eukprot:308494_1
MELCKQILNDYPFAIPSIKLAYGIVDSISPSPSSGEFIEGEVRAPWKKYSKQEVQGLEQKGVASLMARLGIASSLAPCWIPWTWKIYNLYKMEQPKFELTDKEIYVLIASGIGMSIRLFSRLYLGKFFTYLGSIRHDHKLITKGPYSIVRHPGYTGFLLCLWCDAIYYNSTSFYIYSSILTHFIFNKMNDEESALSNRFGTEYDQYLQTTKAKLFPFIY